MTNTPYEVLCQRLELEQFCWLITGVAGFIGSHLLEKLLSLNQKVIGLDNFSTGSRANLQEVLAKFSTDKAKLFHFIEGDIRDYLTCETAVTNADFILHQAALGSVPRSLKDPLTSHAVNVDGFLNITYAASQQKNIKRMVYASSSSVYGDSPHSPKQEEQTGEPLSPYAVTKKINEMYAKVFARCYSLPIIGLRYFNVFGARQDPNGPYAAVIPIWIKNLLTQEPVSIYGDGETGRDFCYIENVVQANLLAALNDNDAAIGKVFNIAVGERTSLNNLFLTIMQLLNLHSVEPSYGAFRPGDIRNSLADIDQAKTLLGYKPTHRLQDGLKLALGWYQKNTV